MHRSSGRRSADCSRRCRERRHRSFRRHMHRQKGRRSTGRRWRPTHRRRRRRQRPYRPRRPAAPTGRARSRAARRIPRRTVTVRRTRASASSTRGRLSAHGGEATRGVLDLARGSAPSRRAAQRRASCGDWRTAASQPRAPRGDAPEVESRRGGRRQRDDRAFLPCAVASRSRRAARSRGCLSARRLRARARAPPVDAVRGCDPAARALADLAGGPRERLRVDRRRAYVGRDAGPGRPPARFQDLHLDALSVDAMTADASTACSAPRCRDHRRRSKRIRGPRRAARSRRRCRGNASAEADDRSDKRRSTPRQG